MIRSVFLKDPGASGEWIRVEQDQRQEDQEGSCTGMQEREDEVLSQSRGCVVGSEFPREAWGSGVRSKVAGHLLLLQNRYSCSPTPARLYPTLPLRAPSLASGPI